MTLVPGNPAPDLTLPDDLGEEVRFSEVWRRQSLVLLFVRHFGWPFCREHVVDVRNDYAKFQEARGEVLVVTMGSVAQAAAFRKRHDLPFRCLADPDRKAYQAYEVERGSLAQIAGPAVWSAGAKAFLKHGVGIPQQDTKQLQGAFIIDTSGAVRYRHSPAHSAQNPTNEELLVVLREIEGNTDVL